MTTKSPEADAFTKDCDDAGVHFLGVAAAGMKENGVQFSIVAPDETSLESVWNDVMQVPLNHGEIQSVKIYSAD